jgi:hypothetical protein
MGYIPTERIFTCVETGHKYRLYIHPEKKNNKLISEIGHSPEFGFYASSFAQTIKLNTGKIVELQAMSFYALKEVERVTHRKLLQSGDTYLKRFSKI